MNTPSKVAVGGTAAAAALIGVKMLLTVAPGPAMFPINFWVPDTNVVAVEVWHTTNLAQPFSLLASIPYTPTNPASASFPETNQAEFFIIRAVDSNGFASAWATNPVTY